MFQILIFIINNCYFNSHWIDGALEDFFLVLFISSRFWRHFRKSAVYGIRNKQFSKRNLLIQWLYMSQCYSTPFMRLQKGVIARYNYLMIQQSYFFDIQYSLLQNNIYKLEIKLYLLSTSTIDHDEIFFRNLLSEQVYVFFPFRLIFNSCTNCGQVI